MLKTKIDKGTNIKNLVSSLLFVLPFYLYFILLKIDKCQSLKKKVFLYKTGKKAKSCGDSYLILQILNSSLEGKIKKNDIDGLLVEVVRKRVACANN